MTDTALGRWFGLRRTPGSIPRFVFGLMPMLYRLRLDRLLGHQFLLVDHRGRTSGRRYVTALKLLAYDPSLIEADATDEPGAVHVGAWRR